MKSLAIIFGAASLGSCMVGPPQPANADAQAHLARLLADKVPTGTASCMPEYRSTTAPVIAPKAIAFPVNPTLAYVVDTTGTGCEGLGGFNHTLVTVSRGSTGLCSGDIVRIVDSSTGLTVGSCPIGPMVAYRRP